MKNNFFWAGSNSSSVPPLSEILNRLEFLYAIAHSTQWLLAAFAREAERLGVAPSQLWHLWHCYEIWGR
ncbi:MAG: hypothetical protein KME35_23715 [Aphanocapsa sp. GSE-SYN-MK-11-07L]|nr:hypothetical protein [Aphanocapsa sp. GSE-SYN-MK-11-07L]